jgi:hypothetical protein
MFTPTPSLTEGVYSPMTKSNSASGGWEKRLRGRPSGQIGVDDLDQLLGGVGLNVVGIAIGRR